MNKIENAKRILSENGFIPLIDYEERFNDRLLIFSPSTKFRNGNVVAKINQDGSIAFEEIETVIVDTLTGYRIPKFKNKKTENYVQ
jgi:hypothetical protein